MKIDDKKINFTLCFSFIRISLTLCADPIVKKDDLTLYAKWRKSLLKEGIYAPSRSSLIANLKWFDMKNLIFVLMGLILQ